MTRNQIPKAARSTVYSGQRVMPFVRRAIAAAVTDNAQDAESYALERWGLNIKAALPALNTQTDGGAATISSESGASEFFDAVRAQSIIGRLAVTKVPFRTRALVMNEGARVVWRDEGAAYGNSPLSMSAIAGLEPYDCGALIVATNEQLRDASIDAELQIQNQLVKALASALDAAFIDPSNSGTAGIKPASVTNASSSMNSPSEALFDWSDEFQGDANGSVILLNPYTAARLQSSNRPYVGSQDGSLGGWPVYTSTSVGPEDIVYLYPPAIMVALGNADLRVSTQASVEMVDTSSMTSATSVAAVNTTSLWQTNATGIIGSITANWVVTRPGAVAVSTRRATASNRKDLTYAGFTF